jgi:hypothetical protein
VGRFRSSIALASSGFLIAIFLIAKGPTLGDKGAGPLRAAAESLDTKQRELAAAVEARASTLAQLPRLSWAVATDEETVRDLTTDELGFRAQPGEVIALAQIDKKTGHAVTLLHAPPAAALWTPSAPGMHAIVVGGELLVASVATVEPRERADAVTGALVVARRLDVAAAADQLIRAGIAARLITAEGSATLTEVPALAREPEIIVPIGTSSGMQLAGRLPGHKRGVWVALAFFVLLIWGGAAALAARRGTLRAAELPPPGMNGLAGLPPPNGTLFPDTTPMLDLVVAQRNITASSSSNGFHVNGLNGVHGAAVSPVVEIVSGPVAVGVPHSEAMPASKADFPALFREFMDLRKRCGDRSKAPSYDEFFKLLDKRRREMLETHTAADVMFQIVFIDGRAVVRAKGVH